MKPVKKRKANGWIFSMDQRYRSYARITITVDIFLSFDHSIGICRLIVHFIFLQSGGKKKGITKKSIFASPETVEGKVTMIVNNIIIHDYS